MSLSKWLGIAGFVVILLLGQKYVWAQTTGPQRLSQNAQQFIGSLPHAWLQNAGDLWTSGEILVGRSANQSARTLTNVEALLGYQPTILQSLVTGGLARADAVTIERWQVTQGEEWVTIALLQKQPGILFAEPNWTVRAAAPGTIPTAIATSSVIISPTANSIVPPLTQPYVPNDPLYLDGQWYLQRINAPRALALLDNGSGHVHSVDEITVGVIDSGIDLAHPEFQGRILEGYNFWDNSLDPDTQRCELPADTLVPIIDDFGHGTHVSGLIGAALNNQSGLASIAPFVKLQPLKILNGNGSGTVFDLATAITYAASCLHVNIINLSLEISASVLDNNPVLNEALHSAVIAADAEGVLMIAAGGNSGGTVVPYPAAYSEVMGVAALNINNNRTSYSTMGSQIDIAAPGGESTTTGGTRIYSTWSKDAVTKCRDGSYQLLDGGSYCNDHGTSMATPLVVGTAALIWGIDPTLSADEVWDILVETATPLGLPAEQVGAGRVDAHAALRRVLTSDMALEHDNYFVQSDVDTSPISLTVRMENASAQSVAWNAQVITGSDWISLESVGNKAISSTAAYAEPAFLQVLLTPDSLTVGEHDGTIGFRATNSNGVQIAAELKIRISLNESGGQIVVSSSSLGEDRHNALALHSPAEDGAAVIYLPLVAANPVLVYYFPWIVFDGPAMTSTPSPTVTPTATPLVTPTPTMVPATSAPAAVAPVAVGVPFQWETPQAVSDRTIYTLTDEMPVQVTFPQGFAFPMRGQVYDDLRIFADGYIALPATEPGASADNRCLLDLADPGQAIYGWWRSLDSSAAGSEISSFSIGADRFVVEFKDVPTISATPDYSVSFQIVMFSSGDIQLNYLDAPSFNGRPAPVTVGVEARDGRFGFQIACSTETEVIGTLPQSGQSFLIKADYLY